MANALAAARCSRCVIPVTLSGCAVRVRTKRPNEQVKRNRERFAADFLLQLTPAEKAEVVANCDHLQKLKFPKVLPPVPRWRKRRKKCWRATPRICRPSNLEFEACLFK